MDTRTRLGSIYQTIGLALAILGLAIVPRVWALDTMPTPDEDLWVARSTRFLAHLLTLTPGVTIEDGVPGVTTRWTGAVGLIVNYGTHPSASTAPAGLLEFLTTLDSSDASLLPAMRLPTALIAALCVMVLYLLVRRMFGELAALLAAILLALDPFLIGLSRVLHHDGLVANFAGVAVLGLLVYLTEEHPPRWLLFLAGSAAGLALLSKSTGLFLFPYAMLIAAISCLRWEGSVPRLDRGRVQRAIARLSGWGLVAVTVIVALWPALWVDPSGTLHTFLYVGTTFATEPHGLGNYFLGQPVDDPGILFYPVAFLFRVTPTTLVGMVATLYPFRDRALSSHSKPRPGFYVLALWAFVLLFMAFVTLGAKKVDRYVLPVVPLADVLAGAGLAGLVNLFWHGLSRWKQRQTARSRGLVEGISLALILLLQASLLQSLAPHYLAYFNPLLGGTRGAAAVIPIGWSKGCDLVTHYLNGKEHAADLDVATYHIGSCLEPQFEGTIWRLQTESLSERAGLPWYAMDYVVITANQAQRRLPNSAFIDFFLAQQPEYVACADGYEQAWLYTVPKVIPENVLPTSRSPIYEISANFDNQVQLVHYAWGDANLQRADEFAAGETAYLALRWRTKRPLTSQYKVFVHVYDRRGRLITQADTLLGGKDGAQSLQIRPSGKIMTYLELGIPPATPPGNYTMAVGLYDPATGQRLSLLNETGQAIGTAAYLKALPVGRPATPPTIADLPIQHPLSTKFPEGLTLLGYDLLTAEGRAGEPLTVALYWQAQRDSLADLTVELQLRDAAGQVWARQASQPADDTYPTSRWVAGEIVRDAHDVTVDAATPPGDMRLVLTIRTANPWIPVQETTLATVPIVGRQHVFQAPTVAHPQVVDLEGVRFLGYDLAATTVRAGEPVQLTLYWQCQTRMETSYKVFIHLVDEGQQPWGQVDRIPCAGECPTTGWLPGEYLTETYPVVPRPGTPPGTYRIIVGLYDEQTGARMTRANGAGDHIVLNQTLTVQQP